MLLLASLDAKFRRAAQLAGPQLCSVATDDASAAEARQHDVPPVEVRLAVMSRPSSSQQHPRLPAASHCEHPVSMLTACGWYREQTCDKHALVACTEAPPVELTHHLGGGELLQQ